jgi:hypothetical protein
MQPIYVHLDPTNFPFSKDLSFSNYTFNEIPEYATIGFEQTKKLLKRDPILLSNKDIVEFENDIVSFFDICKKGFPSFYKDTFWLLTLLRLYVVNLYVNKHNITKFIHLEYDNLIYSDLSVLEQLSSSVYFTRVGPCMSSAGFMYCNSLDHFNKFIDKIKQLLSKGEKFVRQFTGYDHLSEMILIDLIYEHTKNVIDYLPILPFGKGNDNFDKLQVLFDGASYGQYIGGTNNGDGKGWTGRHHYTGCAIQNNIIKVTYDKVPYVTFNGKQIPILNLHIHSKKLKDYLC